MKEKQSVFLCIDLKTFFASVECVERHYDPFEVDLVVADPSRGKGALCLAISPKMKARGIKNRCRMFEIPADVEYITAVPRMNKYMEYSAWIYSIYLKYVAQEDIHVYSIDECFLDVTAYLDYYKMRPTELAKKIVDDVFEQTGITATVGIGTNLYLTKIALDITAKHVKDNMGCLNQRRYRETLWHHKPLTDFWHLGAGTANRLLKYGIDDMYGIAHCNEDILYKEFGINAEYIIDHAWGREPCTMADIKKYRSKTNSISQSQVLFSDYEYNDALLVMKEMVELKVLDLVDKHLVTNHISLGIGYSNGTHMHTGGSRKIGVRTNSYKILLDEFINLYKQTTSREAKIRTIGISFGNVLDEVYEYYDLFTDLDEITRERSLNESLVQIKDKYGKNAILRGMNFLDNATTRKRNTLVGGHNAE